MYETKKIYANVVDIPKEVDKFLNSLDKETTKVVSVNITSGYLSDYIAFITYYNY